MTGLLHVIVMLLIAGAFVVIALGFLFPSVPAKQRTAAVFYFFTAAAAFMQAWRWGS